MTDVLTLEQRSRCMSAIRNKNTSPEVALRSALHRLGYRYRVNCATLPGKPDLVFPGRRKVIFIHGCFWHRHRCKAGLSVPSTRKAFWTAKLMENKRRDARQIRQLKGLGWQPLVVWQCELKKSRLTRTLSRVATFLQ